MLLKHIVGAHQDHPARCRGRGSCLSEGRRSRPRQPAPPALASVKTPQRHIAFPDDYRRQQSRQGAGGHPPASTTPAVSASIPWN